MHGVLAHALPVHGAGVVAQLVWGGSLWVSGGVRPAQGSSQSTGGLACCVISAVAKPSGGVTLAATAAPGTSS